MTHTYIVSANNARAAALGVRATHGVEVLGVTAYFGARSAGPDMRTMPLWAVRTIL